MTQNILLCYEDQTVVECQYTMTQNTFFMLWGSNSCWMSVHYDSKYTIHIVSLKQLLNVSTLWLKIHSLYCECQIKLLNVCTLWLTFDKPSSRYNSHCFEFDTLYSWWDQYCTLPSWVSDTNKMMSIKKKKVW